MKSVWKTLEEEGQQESQADNSNPRCDKISLPVFGPIQGVDEQEPRNGDQCDVEHGHTVVDHVTEIIAKGQVNKKHYQRRAKPYYILEKPFPPGKQVL